MRIKNISSQGELDVPLLGRIVGAGETVDVSEDQALALLAQHSNFEPDDKPARAITTKHDEARAAGLPAHDPAAEASAEAPATNEQESAE